MTSESSIHSFLYANKWTSWFPVFHFIKNWNLCIIENLSKYIWVTTYQIWARFVKVIREIIWCSFCPTW